MAAAIEMQDLLYNDATLQSLLSTWVKAPTTFFMVFNRSLLPNFVGADSGNIDIDISKKTINHFPVDMESGAHPVKDITRQVSCRSNDPVESEKIQTAAFNALNRVKASNGKAFFVASKLPPIAPNDETDNWNYPLNVRTISVNN